MRPKLDAREYKLLLNPAFFRDAIDVGIANEFLRGRLTAIVCARTAADPKGDFELKARRQIAFYDTAERLLDKWKYALRRRDADGEPAELTLKLRTPDLFVAAATHLRGRKDGAEIETKFEEDIAPLEVAVPGAAKVTIADPPSMRSRFSLSTTQPSGRRLDDLHDAFELYPDLEHNLEDAGATFVAREPLIAGPSIVETVFEGPHAVLDQGVRTKLTLTWWEFQPPQPVAQVAELSYKVKTTDGDLSRDAARHASRLFIGLQAGLPPDCLDLEHPSKTALALPAPAVAHA